jgi:myo-inositol-1(or 4)-monophosphatase
MIKNTLLKAVEAGGKELKHFFNGSFTISSKGSLNDLVTEADHAAEKAIFKVIQEAFPTHFILSEETGEIKQDSKIKWIIFDLNFCEFIKSCFFFISQYT